LPNSIPIPPGGKIAGLEKTIDALTNENGMLKEKLAAAHAAGDIAVAKAQLVCAREQYAAVDAALEKGYERAQRAFADARSFVFKPAKE
jgi:uncharacterized protein YecT (DUF1311 family)